jgi:uncharacterized repeat protein (TIGR02543 family)
LNIKSNNQIRKFLYGMTLAGMILALCFGLSHPPAANAQGAWSGIPAETDDPQAAPAVPLETSFTLDGVLVSVRESSLPSADFAVSEPGSASQVATSVTWEPFREFSVVAVPFGSKPATEALPAAGSGLKPTYDIALRNYRLQQGGRVQDGLTVTLFGQQVTGLHSLVDLFIDGPVPKPVVIDEWVVEAGDRLWIIRSSEEQFTNSPALQPGNFPGELVLSSSTLNHPSTVNDQPTKNPAMELNQKVMAGDLPTPAWWHGDCDYDTYTQKSGGTGSYRLGAVYLGLPACGPRPYYDHAPDVQVHFFHGGWGVMEWECVEYAMRFLYLLYGISPYKANGSEVVWNYSGDQLVQIANGTAGQAPVPNDVLSYGPTSTSGHTSVVTASNVDENGNGTITVIEENASVSGSSTLTVTDWSVAGNAGSVSGWLHTTMAPLTLSVNKTGTGVGTVTSNPSGINCNPACSHAFNYYTVVVLTATAATGSTFTGWSGDCSGMGTCTITTDTDRSVTATFNLQSFTLSVSKNGAGSGIVTSNPAGINCGSTCSTLFTNNTVVTLTATNTSPSTFGGWSGAGCSGTGTCTVTMSSTQSVTATFNSPGNQTLTVSKNGTGSGTATSSPVGIDCGLTCSASFNYNTSVTLTTTPSTGSTFAGWSGACSGTGTCTVTMDADKVVTATFTLNAYTLSISKSGTGSGTATSSPVGIDCGLTCSASFNYNTSVTLTTIPSTGSTFAGWSGACSGTGTCTVTMDADKAATATFTLNTYTLSVSKSGTGSGTVTSVPVGIDCGSDCSEDYIYNTSITLTATASTGFTFTGWGGVCSGTGTCTVTMDANKAVTANFEPTQQIFVDVLPDHWAASWIVRLYQAGITSGCATGPLRYCPEDPVTRAQMAVFLERGMQGSAYAPPAGTGAVFADVPLSYWAADWIEKFYADGITSGCGTDPLIYCPDNPVTRAQMAVFLLRARHGAAYTPPEVEENTGFNDVPDDYWAAAWIKQLAAEAITTGCGSDNYCPENPVTRAEMAVFLVRAFNLP